MIKNFARKPNIFIFCFILLPWAFTGMAQEKTKQATSPERFIELKALEIKAKIHEPALFYVLDQPNLRLHFEEVSPTFVKYLKDPIEGKAKW